MPVAIAQMRRLLAAPEKNKARMLGMMKIAKSQGAEMIVFPELALSGTLYDDMVGAPYLLEQCRKAAMDIAAAAEGIQVVFGNLGLDELGQAVSRVYYAANGILKPVDACTAAGLVEETPYRQGDEGRVLELMLDGSKKRVLFLLGNWDSKPLPKTLKDADLVISLTPKAISFDGSYQARPLLNKPFIQIGAIGLMGRGKSNYLLAGQSAYYDHQGRLLACSPEFKEDVTIFPTAVSETANAGSYRDIHLAEALVEGVREFCLSIKVKRAVIGISGGIDSALAACIYREALGADNVFLLSMPTIFNSCTTKTLAEGMAKGLGSGFMTMPLDNCLEQFYQSLQVNPFLDAAGKQTKIELSDKVKENIMARERARVLAAAAAGLNSIFTCNSNKAEFTVGYATFYGDLAGAFAAQADLWKYQVYHASAYFQQLFPDAPLDKIAAIRPSAELSLAQDVTRGLGDPLVYAYHDYLLKSWVEGGETPTSTLKSYQAGTLAADIGCEPQLPGELFPDAESFIADLEYWWQMYRGIGVAKRLQSPPLLAVSSRPFGDSVRELQGATFFDDEFARLKKELIR